ncbi:MAG: phosphotransferase [Actinomycetota bacterium]
MTDDQAAPAAPSPAASRPHGAVVHARPAAPGDTVDGGRAGPGWIDHTWSGTTWSLADRLVRIKEADGDTDDPDAPTTGWVDAEAERHRWLASRPEGLVVGPPEVVGPTRFESTRPPGAPAHRPELHPRPDAVPAAVGTLLARLHAIDVDHCPFRAPRSALVEELGAAVGSGLLVPELLPPPYDRYQPEQLLAMVGEATPVDADPVVGHGGPVLSNLWIATDGRPPEAEGGGAVTGLGRLGVTDRHLDLAIVHRQLHLAYGPEAVFAFHEAYGVEPGLVALDQYLLIDVLRGALAGAVSPVPS